MKPFICNENESRICNKVQFKLLITNYTPPRILVKVFCSYLTQSYLNPLISQLFYIVKKELNFVCVCVSKKGFLFLSCNCILLHHELLASSYVLHWMQCFPTFLKFQYFFLYFLKCTAVAPRLQIDSK